MTLTDADFEEVAKGWKEEDRASHARRAQLVSRMADLRAINESLADWIADAKEEWFELDKEDAARHADRLAWNKQHTTVHASAVPSLANHHARTNNQFEAPGRIPDWVDTLCISTMASKLAWNAIQAGQCGADVSTSGGAAVKGLYDMLAEAKRLRKAPISASNGKPVPFHWDSHGYNATSRRAAVEANLGISAAPDANHVLPREYEQELHGYARTAVHKQDLSSCCSDELGEDDERSVHVQDCKAEASGAPSAPPLPTRLASLSLNAGVSAGPKPIGVGLKKPGAANNGNWWASSW